jgi:hypothetical protein
MTSEKDRPSEATGCGCVCAPCIREKGSHIGLCVYDCKLRTRDTIPGSSEATPAPEKRGIDGESYTVRRFVLDHCAALGAEYEEDFRKDLLRMLAEVRAFEREACAQLFLGGGTYAGTDAAELIRSAKGGV